MRSSKIHEGSPHINATGPELLDRDVGLAWVLRNCGGRAVLDRDAAALKRLNHHGRRRASWRRPPALPVIERALGHSSCVGEVLLLHVKQGSRGFQLLPRRRVRPLIIFA